MKLGGGGEPCTLCCKTVYPAERLKSPLGLYHVKCFSCTKCKRQLQMSTFVEDSATGRLYCRPHYAQLAKEAGLERMSKGGVDAAAGVLVQKQRKAEAKVEVDHLVVGASVWVERGVDRASRVSSTPASRSATCGEEPFERAEVVHVGDETIGVKKSSGMYMDVPPESCMLAEPAAQSGKVNNLQLLHLNEPNLLDNVRERFRAGQIYTYTGQLELLCVNPYEDIPGLYSEATMKKHRDATDGEEPHTFAVAERVWRAVQEQGAGRRRPGRRGALVHREWGEWRGKDRDE